MGGRLRQQHWVDCGRMRNARARPRNPKRCRPALLNGRRNRSPSFSILYSSCKTLNSRIRSRYRTARDGAALLIRPALPACLPACLPRSMGFTYLLFIQQLDEVETKGNKSRVPFLRPLSRPIPFVPSHFPHRTVCFTTAVHARQLAAAEWAGLCPLFFFSFGCCCCCCCCFSVVV